LSIVIIMVEINFFKCFIFFSILIGFILNDIL
jgi:hypothetical protein